jgi:periplasmic protein TonB
LLNRNALMASYSGTAREDRAKALAGVLLVHIVLGVVILTGLNVHDVQRVVETLKTFDIDEPPPPPPPQPPPPRERAQRAKEEEGAAGKKAEPSPVVVPKPKIEIPAKSPVAAAPVAGTGSATTSGAANYGTGPGAGGSGTGRGGGGTGDFSGYTPAQRISKIPDREYRRIRAASGQSSGRIGITLKVNTDGRPSNCRIVRTSGNPTVDDLFCELAIDHVRFRPARDADGRPVAQDITWYPDWSPR